MTVEQMAIVLNHSKTSGTAKVVMIAIANHDGDGGAFPSIDTLAEYANKDVRTVQRALKAAVALGELVVHRQEGGMAGVPEYLRTNRYEILVRCPDDCDRTARHMTDAKRARYRARRQPGGDIHRGDTNVTPLWPDVIHRGDTSVTGGGDKTVTGGVTPASPKPSLEPSLRRPWPPSTGASPDAEVVHSAAGSNDGQDRADHAPHRFEANAVAALTEVQANSKVGIPVPELLAEAYRIGGGDPWFGYQVMRHHLEIEYPGARSRPAVIRRVLADIPAHGSGTGGATA